MKKTLITLITGLLMLSFTQAAVYVWDGEATGTGNSRFNKGDNWDTDTNPASANDTDLIFTATTKDPGSTYSNYTVRSITFDDTIDAGFGFGINRSAAYVRSITFSSATTARMEVEAGATGAITLTGTVHTASGVQNAFNLSSSLDVIHNGSNNLTISARIGGANGITKTGTGTLRFNSANNNYTGDTFVNEGRLSLLTGSQLYFNIGSSGTNNQLTGTGAGEVILNGNLRFDLSAAGTTIGDMWQIVDVANLDETYSATDFSALSTVGSFTETADVWRISENGVSYEFSEATGFLSVVPEPSSTALLGLGGLALILRRRK